MTPDDHSKEEPRKQLEGCNYGMAKALVVRNFSGSVIPKELASILDSFTSNPCFETAERLIEYDSKFLAFFELARGGGFTERLFRMGDIE